MQVRYKRQGRACGGMCSSATQRRFNMHLTCLFPLIAQMFHTLTDMRRVPYATQKSPQAMTSQQLPKALPLERFLVRQIPQYYIKHLSVLYILLHNKFALCQRCQNVALTCLHTLSHACGACTKVLSLVVWYFLK